MHIQHRLKSEYVHVCSKLIIFHTHLFLLTYESLKSSDM